MILRTKARRRPGRRGFTLVEILLVIVIMTIAAAMVMPALNRSIQGHRLTTASRAMVTVAKYARSMAILKQCDLSVSFNVDSGQVDLVSTNTSLPRFQREVQGVKIDYVKVEGGDPVTEGTVTIAYRRNGVCKPFEIKIVDSQGHFVRVKVDALSSVKTLEQGTD